MYEGKTKPDKSDRRSTRNKTMRREYAEVFRPDMLPWVKGVVQGVPFSQAYALVIYNAAINPIAYAIAATFGQRVKTP